MADGTHKVEIRNDAGAELGPGAYAYHPFNPTHYQFRIPKDGDPSVAKANTSGTLDLSVPIEPKELVPGPDPEAPPTPERLPEVCIGVDKGLPLPVIYCGPIVGVKPGI